MPKEKRPDEEVKEVKDEILSQAQRIIALHGLEGLSMRKLAKELGLTSTTIYNYYHNKDELFLMILTKGFEDIYDTCLAVYQTRAEPYERIYAMAQAYIDFGIQNPSLYSLMFIENGPQYKDHSGTKLEIVARNELATSRKIGRLFIDTIIESAGKNSGLTDEDFEFYLTHFWCLLHGFIAGYNNTVLEYIHPNPLDIKERMLRQIIKTLAVELG
jgi:AcrR family transcriptional regulator